MGSVSIYLFFFNIKCCNIGTASGHRMGFMIIYYMNEFSQWKVL